MAFTFEQIARLIKLGQPQFITDAKKEQRKLDMHVNGHGVAEYLAKIEGYENKEQFVLRKKFAMSNKFLNANVLRPVDKVFTAKGGSKIYTTKGSEKTEKELRALLNNIAGGNSITKWINKVQANKYYSDPSGLVYFEVSEDGKQAIVTIKSIQSITNYEIVGRDVLWVLFGPERFKDDQGETITGKFYRFVDEEKDWTILADGDRIVEITEDTKPDNWSMVKPSAENRWDRVPGIVNSEIINDRLKFNDSPIDIIIELQDKYLRTNSIKSIHEFLHGFPVFWMYHKKCDSCKGTGEVGGETCKVCNGSGASLKRDVSDALLLKTPKDKESPTIAPDVAGYVVPPNEIPEEQRTELGWLYQLQYWTLWGTMSATLNNINDSFEKRETATGRILDVDPLNDRRTEFSEAFEDMEQRMTNFIGEFYLPNSYDGSSINYGRRYQMESPDALWKKYMDAKTDKGPRSSLDTILTQYYQSEFANDVEMLQISLKGLKLEPYVHTTIEDAQTVIPPEQFIRKVAFSEWWKSLDPQHIFLTDVDKLSKELDKFIKQNSNEQES